MAKAIQDVRKALSKFDPDHDYWDSARLNMGREDYPAVEQFYKSPEWSDFRWMFHHRLTKQCAKRLIESGLVKPDLRIQSVFNLSEKGARKNAPRK